MEEALMNYFKRLLTILQKEHDAIELVLKLENEKYDALKSVDVKKLMELNSQEEGLLELLSSTEKKRKELIVSLSKEFNLDKNLSLNDLIEIFNEKIDNDLKVEIITLKDRIKHISERLRAVVRENEELIKSNMEIISLTLSFASKHSLYETYNHRNRGDGVSKVYLINSLA
ncbi:MAG: flagellar protein FlgN [Brevinematia bacterium]